MLADLAAAAVTVADPVVIAWVFAGVLLGLLCGATPGLTGTMGVALALPITFQLSFTLAMALLLGIYVGGYFAGTIPAVLINTPGAPGNAATSLDGYPMARRGEAERAITLAIMGSLAGGLVSVIILAAAAPPLSQFALNFQSAEYFALGLFGLLCVAAVSRGNVLKGIVAAALGALLAMVGIDPVSGVQRLTMGSSELLNGISLLPALLAFFAVAEIIAQSRGAQRHEKPTRQQPIALLAAAGAFWRERVTAVKGALIGTFIGVLPGAGPTIASWISYGEAARTHGDRKPALGDGSERGIVASESANNAVTGGALVPMLTLGIPGDTVTAVLVGAFLIQGLEPGPFFMRTEGDLFAQILLLLLLGNLLMVGVALAVRRGLPLVLRIPQAVLLPIVAALCVTGGFAINNAPFDVVLIGVLGVAGYIFAALGVPMAPVVLGMVLGPIVEENLRNALTSANGDWSVFVTRPISATLLAAVIVVIAGRILRDRRSRAR